MNPIGLTDYIVTEHAMRGMAVRGLAPELIQTVLSSPDQRFTERSGRDVFQRVVATDSGPRLVRVFVDTDREPPVVVTAYRTSRISRYWSSSP